MLRRNTTFQASVPLVTGGQPPGAAASEPEHGARSPGSPVAQISSKRSTSGLPRCGSSTPSAARGCSTWKRCRKCRSSTRPAGPSRRAPRRPVRYTVTAAAEAPHAAPCSRAHERFVVARVVDDDVEPRVRRGRRRNAASRSLRAGPVPAHLRQVDVEDADRAPGEADQLVDRRDLRGDRSSSNSRRGAGAARRLSRLGVEEAIAIPVVQSGRWWPPAARQLRVRASARASARRASAAASGGWPRQSRSPLR